MDFVWIFQILKLWFEYACIQFIILYLNKIFNYLYYDQYIYTCNIKNTYFILIIIILQIKII